MPQGGRHRDLEGDRGWNEAASSEHEGQALREAPGCRSGQETALSSAAMSNCLLPTTRTRPEQVLSLESPGRNTAPPMP